jgi:hypothetical protein
MKQDNIFSKGYIVETEVNRITFLDSRFYLDVNGSPQPSVTSVLDCYPKSAGYYQWLKTVGQDADNLRDEAGRKGSVVHKMTEYLDFGNPINLLDDNSEPVCSMNEWAMFERYVDFRRRFTPEVHHIELDYCSAELGFGGTLDRIVTLNGKNILFDIKTGNNIYPSHWLQQAAYVKLFEEMSGKNKVVKKMKLDQVGILWLNANTKTEGKKDAIQGVKWQLITKSIKESEEEDWPIFQATHKLWLAENKNSAPKNFSYSLTHKI